jgi:hypothetical protein
VNVLIREVSGHWRGAADDLIFRHVTLPKSLVVHGVDHARVHNLAALAVLAVCSLGSDRSASRRGFLARSRRGVAMGLPLCGVRHFSIHDASRLHGNQPSVATSVMFEMRSRPYNRLMSAFGADSFQAADRGAHDRGWLADVRFFMGGEKCAEGSSVRFRVTRVRCD